MRILTHTIFDTILLPLIVVAAMYGINGIDLMRIIGLAEGFAIVAMTMLVTIVVTLFFLRKNDGFLILMTILMVWLKRRDILILFYDVIFL